MEERISAAIAELKQRLEVLYGDQLAYLVLFGSQARGDADEGSDVDLLVVLRGEVRPGEEISRTIDDVAELSLEYSVVLSCTFVSLDRYERYGASFLANVRREGLLV